MSFRIDLSVKAERILSELKSGKKKDVDRLKKVNKALKILSEDPKYPSLRTHPFHDGERKYGDAKVSLWTSYIENGTPDAWRVIWRYGPNEGMIEIITVIWIGGHY